MPDERDPVCEADVTWLQRPDFDAATLPHRWIVLAVLGLLCVVVLPLSWIVAVWNWLTPSQLANGGLDRP